MYMIYVHTNPNPNVLIVFKKERRDNVKMREKEHLTKNPGKYANVRSLVLSILSRWGGGGGKIEEDA